MIIETAPQNTFPVSLTPVNAKSFIARGDRRVLAPEGEITLLIYDVGNDPIAFVMPYAPGAEDLFELERSENGELKTYTREALIKSYSKSSDEEGSIKAALVGSKHSQEKYIYWSLNSFLAMGKHSAIRMPVAMEFYLRNHLEKPYYKQSPILSFSPEGLLTEQATVFARLSGPTASIVYDNHIAIKLIGKSGKNYLLLPATPAVLECLSGFNQNELNGAFYHPDLEKNLPQGEDINTIFLGKIYDYRLCVVPLSDSHSLPIEAQMALETLSPKSDSIARKVHSPKSLETPIDASLSDAVKKSRERSSGGSRTYAPPDKSIGLSLQELAALGSLTRAFNKACKNPNRSVNCIVKGKSLRFYARDAYVTAIRQISAAFSEIGGIKARSFDLSHVGFTPDNPALKIIFESNAPEFCLTVTGRQSIPVIIIPEGSKISGICDAIAVLEHP